MLWLRVQGSSSVIFTFKSVLVNSVSTKCNIPHIIMTCTNFIAKCKAINKSEYIMSHHSYFKICTKIAEIWWQKVTVCFQIWSYILMYLLYVTMVYCMMSLAIIMSSLNCNQPMGQLYMDDVACYACKVIYCAKFNHLYGVWWRSFSINIQQFNSMLHQVVLCISVGFPFQKWLVWNLNCS